MSKDDGLNAGARFNFQRAIANHRAWINWSTPRKENKPIGGLMDSRYRYIRSEHTNVAATIARVKAEIANGERKL